MPHNGRFQLLLDKCQSLEDAVLHELGSHLFLYLTSLFACYCGKVLGGPEIDFDAHVAACKAKYFNIPLAKIIAAVKNLISKIDFEKVIGTVKDLGGKVVGLLGNIG